MIVGMQSFAQTSSFDALKKQASLEDKKVMLYFSGSDWCGPCIKFKKIYLEDSTFISFANDSLLVFNADFPRKKAKQLSAEKTKENEMLAEKFNPNGAFPYIILMDSEGNVIRKWTRLPKVTVEQFITEIKG